jgi:hypothetical protein
VVQILSAIQLWYASNCDGDWEHAHGIKIVSLDNPGWAVDIDIRETSLEKIQFEPIELERQRDDWVRCNIKDGVFCGRGGPMNLQEILEFFIRLCS